MASEHELKNMPEGYTPRILATLELVRAESERRGCVTKRTFWSNGKTKQETSMNPHGFADGEWRTWDKYGRPIAHGIQQERKGNGVLFQPSNASIGWNEKGRYTGRRGMLFCGGSWGEKHATMEDYKRSFQNYWNSEEDLIKLQ